MGLFLIAIYFFLRQLFFPVYKARSFQVFIDYPLSLTIMFLVGFIIDLARVSGYFKGYFYTK